jgi:predicted O-methyltransferase YrrM
VAHPARVYDYWLGGTNNFPADREAAERVLAVTPGLRWRVRANRAFLARATRFLAGPAGIGQILDLGTGIPGAGNTHEVAQQVAPRARVLYVDNDPIVARHAQALLRDSPQGATGHLQADLREPELILDRAAEVLDFERVATSQTLRTREQVARFFSGLDLVSPGLVQVHRWRPDPDDEAPADAISAHRAVGRK